MKTILLVENHPNLGALYQEELSDAGYYTLRATSGHEASIQVALHHLDLLVLEPLVPGADEVERVLARWPHLPVIINSGHDTSLTGRVWQRAAFVPKSSDLNELVLAIELLLAPTKKRA